MYKVKNLVFFLFYLVLNPRLIKPFLKGVYLPIFIQFEWLKKFNINTIIDVGAHQGKVSKALNYIFPKATIYAFEPSKKNYEKIISLSNNRNIKIENVALSNYRGNQTFFEYSNDTLSSLLQKKNHLIDNSKLLNKTTVNVITLDDYFNKSKLKPLVFLKIDTQGNEGLVLKGGKKILSKIAIIHIEMSFKEFYKGQDLFPDIYNYLINLGFVYAGEVRESHFYPIFNTENQVNAVFLTKDLYLAMLYNS